jgi:endonuclease/exonuclease/phosphatase family metal-dependent hydrolase
MSDLSASPVNTNLFVPSGPSASDVWKAFGVFGICSSNLGNGVNEQKHKPFEERAEQHIADFVRMAPDIIAAQEFRRFAGAKLDPADFLHDLCKRMPGGRYRCAEAARNPSELAFGQAVVYNPRRFYLRETVVRWLTENETHIGDSFSPTKQGFGSMVLGCEFYLVRDGRVMTTDDGRETPTLWVFNVHFPLDESAKLQSAKKLLDIVRGVTQRNHPAVAILGDFNTFYDRSGVQQMTVLTDAGLVDRSALPKHTLDNKERAGTFVGYESDAFKQDPATLSWLDHIVTTPSLKPATASTDAAVLRLWATEQQLQERSTPSDHLAIYLPLHVCG